MGLERWGYFWSWIVRIKVSGRRRWWYMHVETLLADCYCAYIDSLHQRESHMT